MRDLNIMSLDLEFNQPSQTIIQVGVVIGNLRSGEILEEYCQEVNVNEEINPFITNLTGVTQEQTDNGKSLDIIYEDLVSIFKKHNCFRNCLTWGGGDSEALRQQVGKDSEMFLFGRRWIDAKTLFVSHCFANDLKHQSGLAKSMTRIGLKFEGTKHNAMDDAKNTFFIYRRLLRTLHDNYQKVRTGK